MRKCAEMFGIDSPKGSWLRKTVSPASVLLILAFAFAGVPGGPATAVIAVASACLFFAVAAFTPWGTGLAFLFAGFYPVSLTLSKWVTTPKIAGAFALTLLGVSTVRVWFANGRRLPLDSRHEKAMAAYVGALVLVCGLTALGAQNRSHAIELWIKLASVCLPGGMLVLCSRSSDQWNRIYEFCGLVLNAVLLSFALRLALARTGVPALGFDMIYIDNPIGTSNVLLTHFAFFAGRYLYASRRTGGWSEELFLLVLLSLDVGLILKLTQRGAILGLLLGCLVVPMLCRPPSGWRRSVVLRWPFLASVAAGLIAGFFAYKAGSFDEAFGKLGKLASFFKALGKGSTNYEAARFDGKVMPFGSISLRLDSYKTAWDLFLQHPAFGIGFTRFAEHTPIFPHGYPHNIFLDFLVSFGAVGAAFASAIVVLSASALRKASRLLRSQENANDPGLRPVLCASALMVVFLWCVVQVSGGIQVIFPLLLVHLLMLSRLTSIAQMSLSVRASQQKALQ